MCVEGSSLRIPDLDSIKIGLVEQFRPDIAIGGIGANDGRLLVNHTMV